MSWLPDDVREASGGEEVDQIAKNAIHLAHQVLERFPEVRRKHMFIAGGAALSSAAIIAATVAVTRRVRAGRTIEQAVNEVTEDELEGLRLVERDPEKAAPRTNADEDGEDMPPTGTV